MPCAALAQPAEQVEAPGVAGSPGCRGLGGIAVAFFRLARRLRHRGRHGARVPVSRGPGLASRRDTAMLR